MSIATVGSLFAGIGGFDLGFGRAGFEVRWHAEIDRSASLVLARRWPDVPNHGDVTQIDGAAIEPVDVICGGFPCQDLSVAGKRRGFEGERSVLAFEFLRIVREMRSATNGRCPAFIVLENVPGLFTSRGGADFGALLDALADLGPLDIAWRVLDSRYFGVAQRRRRVFVVVDFGGERAEQVLALSEGLRGDPPARRAKRQDAAGTLGSRTDKGGQRTTDLDGHGAYVLLAPTLSTRYGAASGQDIGQPGLLVTHTLRADGFDASEDGTGRGVPLVADPLCANEQRTYTHEGRGNFRVRNVIPFDVSNVTSPDNRSRCAPGDPLHTLAAGAHPPCVAYGIRNDAHRSGEAKTDSPDAEGRMRKRDAGFNVYREEAPTLDAKAPHAVGVQFLLQNNGGGRNRQVLGLDEPHPTLNLRSPNGIVASGVRRLTPRECERLQGFPDDWTRYTSKGELADGPRYKCLGNAVTVNVAEWIGRRIRRAS